MININTDDYSYPLEESRIAKYPPAERDSSRLLVNLGGMLSDDRFKNLPGYLNKGDLLVFNDSKVVKARLLMRKETGALIEVFCLEPYFPLDFDRNFSSTGPVKWKCLIGNLRKWKSGLVSVSFTHKGKECYLWAKRLEKSGDSWIVEFDWSNRSLTFSDILLESGRVPIPPYLARPDEEIDTVRYQTIYCTSDGSVAAPTAGLHFTQRVLDDLGSAGIRKASITLHVSAGTFKPIKSHNIFDHEMHTEHFFIKSGFISALRQGRVIAVGTTSLRALESLYWTGVSLAEGRLNPAQGPYVGQWEAYKPHRDIPVDVALDAVGDYIESQTEKVLAARTSLIIVPGYRFRIVDGLITNFHIPGSTLLMLVAAFTGNGWRDMYNYAIEREYRFLSYGDSSLIIP